MSRTRLRRAQNDAAQNDAAGNDAAGNDAAGNKAMQSTWRPQFRLRTLLLACVATSGLCGWLAQHDQTYRAEQRFIAALENRTAVSNATMLTVTTNGETTLRTGGYVL